MKNAEQPSIEFKMKDNRIIKFVVTQEHVISQCGPFYANYKHDKLNYMLEMHNKILTPTQLKKLKEFVTINREPEQLSFF